MVFEMAASYSSRFQKRLLTLSSLVLFLILFNISGQASVMEVQRFNISQTEIDQVDYLIITSEDYENVLQSLVEWKMQRGLRSIIETVEDISENYEGEDAAEKIRNCIIDHHENHNTVWVLLAGGNHIVPTRSLRVGDSIVSCDSYYSNLDDNWNLGGLYATLNDPDDWEPEVYVGRLPADTESQMISLVSRLIQYEQNPPVGSWMEHAVYAGTFCNFDYDVNGNNILDDADFPAFDTNRNHNWMKNNLLPDSWTSTLLAENEGFRTTEHSYDLQLNGSTLVNSINAGASIVMADAHGSPTGMFRSVFVTDVDGDSLFDLGDDEIDGPTFLTTSTEFNVDGKLGFYFLAACSTGTFTEGTCLTEYITRTSGIGCIGSSKSSGYNPFMYNYGGEEHLGWATQGLSERVWGQILIKGNNRPGMALALAKADYSDDRVQYDGDDDGGRTMSQYNLMGDPEVPLWISVPSIFETPTINLDEGSRAISVEIEEETSLMDNITITIQGPNYYQSSVSTSLGIVALSMPDLSESTNFIITLSKDGFIPFQIEIELPAGTRLPDFAPVGVVSVMVLAVLVLLFWYKLKRT
ncbi:MAG: C25 family cysteine peptidase [Candidatus Thorarchaeota archaeon]